jgi:hypothetical protein
MHQQIRHNLEDYLRGDYLQDSGLPEEFQAHLGECAECARELQAVAEQARLLRSLRNEQSGPHEQSMEPQAGFYARVVERIEQGIEAQRASFWAPLLDRKFGFRLALASAALMALLGTYLVTSEPAGPEFASAPAVVYTGDSAAVQAAGHSQSEAQAEAPSAAQANAQALQEEQQRDAVLVDLASYHQ